MAAGGLGHLALRYVEERRLRGELLPTSARDYRYRLTLFARFVGWDRRPSTVTRRMVERWLEDMDVAPSTKRVRLIAVRDFYRWCERNGHSRRDPTRDIPIPREPRRQPRGLRREQVEAAVDLNDQLRDQLILLLMVQEGLRAAEVAGLELGDIDPEDRSMVVRGKGGHERVLPISDETWEAIVAVHGARLSVGPVVPSMRDPHVGVGPERISRLANRALRRALVDETGHALRHTMAQAMLRDGASLREVQEALGHRSLDTTARYLGIASVPDLRRTMGRRRYRKRRRSSGDEQAG